MIFQGNPDKMKYNLKVVGENLFRNISQMTVFMSKRKGGFTLIELLVVIAIIALLLSIIMPALNKIKLQARVAVCKTNLAQWATAFELYRIDHDNKALNSQLGKDMWFLQMAPYMGDQHYKENPTRDLEGVMKVLFCPATKPPVVPSDAGCWGTAESRWQYHVTDPATGIYFGAEGSYGLNTWVGGMDIDTMINVYGWIREEDRELSFRDYNPGRADIPVVADSVWVESIPLESDIFNGTFNVSVETGYDDYGIARFYIDRHDMTINMSFTDGHVDNVALDEFWKLKWNRVFHISREEYEALNY